MTNTSLNQDQQAFVQQFEAQVRAAESAQATEIIVGCTNKFQFAKTYRVLRQDFAKSNQQLRDRVRAGNAGAGITEAVVEEMIKVATPIWQAKMDRLSMHFLITWGEPIENYAGSGTGGGCAGVFAALCLIPAALVIIGQVM